MPPNKYQPGRVFPEPEGAVEKITDVADQLEGVQIPTGPQRIAITGMVKMLAAAFMAVSFVFGAGITWNKMSSSMTAETAELRRTITDIEEKQKDHAVILKDMISGGHPDHERRIKALELKEPERVASKVDELTGKLGKLTDIVAADHDNITRMLTLLERRANEKPQP